MLPCGTWSGPIAENRSVAPSGGRSSGQTRAKDGLIVGAAVSLLSAALGSIHAFSVFLDPLERQFAQPRSSVSLTYSLALLALTVAVLIGPRVFGRVSTAGFVLATGSVAAAGVCLAGFAGALPVVWVGYSLIFGAANGLGYGFGLQIAAQVNPGREGLAMGGVTAAYAFGAMVSPAGFDLAVQTGGFRLAMLALAMVLLGFGTISAVLLRRVGARFHTSPENRDAIRVSGRSQCLLWSGYFGSVLAGLMVIGHAAGLAASLNPDLISWLAPVGIAACNLLGSLVGGRLADRLPPGGLLAVLASLTAVTLAALALFGHLGGVLAGLGIVGFAYGGTIAAYPAVVARLFGMDHSARIYGRIFTAWGCAGLAGPWLAGRLFDTSGNYRVALFVAAAIAALSVVPVAVLFWRGGSASAASD